MKTKNLTFLVASIFSLVLLASFVSASFSVSTTSLEFNDNGAKNLIITNNNATDAISVSIPPTFNVDSYSFSISNSGNNNLLANGTLELTITPTNLDFEDLDFEDYFEGSFDITQIGGEGKVETIEVKIEDNDYCNYNDEGNLRLTIDDIKVKSGFGDDDDFWYLGDTIKVEIELDNRGNEDIEDLEIEWCLFDNENKECVLEDDVDEIDVDEGDEEVLEFEIYLNPKKFDDVEDYTLHIRATGEVDDEHNTKTCSSNSRNIDIFIDKDFVVLTDFEEDNYYTSSCGEIVQVSANAWNIGSRDQEDVYVFIYNQDLGLNEEIMIGDIDSFDSESLSLDFEVPSDAKEQTYYIQLMVYDEDDDIFENDEDDSSEYTLYLKVQGNCQDSPGTTADVLVSAELVSEAKAGDELVVKATITNNEDSIKTFTLGSSGSDSWATEASVDPSAITLTAGASIEVLYTFQVNSDTEGDVTFDVNVYSGSTKVLAQPVSVTIEKSGFNLKNIFGDNWYLWLIGALNIILVVVIIIVAIRIAKS